MKKRKVSRILPVPELAKELFLLRATIKEAEEKEDRISEQLLGKIRLGESVEFSHEGQTIKACHEEAVTPVLTKNMKQAQRRLGEKFLLCVKLSISAIQELCGQSFVNKLTVKKRTSECIKFYNSDDFSVDNHVNT